MFVGTNIIRLFLHVLAGRENAEKRRNGYVCNSSCYNVLRHDYPLDSQDDIILIIYLCQRLLCLRCHAHSHPSAMGNQIAN